LDLRETDCEDVDWIQQGTVAGSCVTVMNLQVL